ncbi:putative NAD/NADP octopine/nopaline dehydrogenase [Mycena latifolia]|nr:putative NAD/NADP octopine/nopaline dehydrogenase [Mycena latifolia]
MRVSILGTGSVGCALAVDLESRGHKAVLWAHPAHRSTFNKIWDNEHLKSMGAISGTFYPEATTDLAYVVRSTKIIIITTPSTGHDAILAELAKHDLRTHTIIAISGNFFSLAASRRIEARLLDTFSSPYACRMKGDQVFVAGIKSQLQIAALQDALDQQLRDEIDDVFSMPLTWCRNVVELGMMYFNGVVHAAPAVMNIGRIETAPDFFFYREGMSASVAKVQEQVDRERLEIARAFGFDLEPFLQVHNSHYDTNFADIATVARESVPHSTIRAPTDVKHRYFTEDIPHVLVPWRQLGEIVGVQTSNIYALIVLASTATGIDFMEEGRNARALGLDGLSREGVLKRFARFD